MYAMTRHLLQSTVIVSAAVLTACAEKTAEPVDAAEQSAETAAVATADEKVAQFAQVGSATATLNPTAGNDTSGTVTFTPNADQTAMRVAIKVTGLTPGEHGLHIHEIGDCSAADGSSAGGHFNPENVDHGAPGSAPHHVGDLGNITADAQGNAGAEEDFAALTFSGANSIMNRAVIVHADADDLRTQPTGAAGARVACGVIHLDRDNLSQE